MCIEVKELTKSGGEWAGGPHDAEEESEGLCRGGGEKGTSGAFFFSKRGAAPSGGSYHRGTGGGNRSLNEGFRRVLDW